MRFPCEMFSDRADDQLFDFCGRHAVKLGGLVRLPLNKGCSDIVAIADRFLDSIRRCHPVAAVVEDAPLFKRSASCRH